MAGGGARCSLQVPHTSLETGRDACRTDLSGPRALQPELRAAVGSAVAGSSALRHHSGERLNKSLVTELQSELS